MSLEACEALGIELLLEGQDEAGLRCLREAMERGTQDADVRKAYLQGIHVTVSRAEIATLEAERTLSAETQEARDALLLLLEDEVKGRPEDPDLHLLHGMCLTAMRRYAEAIQAYDRGLALDPSDEGLQLARRQVRERRHP